MIDETKIPYINVDRFNLNSIYTLRLNKILTTYVYVLILNTVYRTRAMGKWYTL